MLYIIQKNNHTHYNACTLLRLTFYRSCCNINACRWSELSNHKGLGSSPIFRMNCVMTWWKNIGGISFCRSRDFAWKHASLSELSWSDNSFPVTGLGSPRKLQQAHPLCWLSPSSLQGLILRDTWFMWGAELLWVERTHLIGAYWHTVSSVLLLSITKIPPPLHLVTHLWKSARGCTYIRALDCFSWIWIPPWCHTKIRPR